MRPPLPPGERPAAPFPAKPREPGRPGGPAQNGHDAGLNGHEPARTAAGEIPASWPPRDEPRQSAGRGLGRPEARGEVGPLIDDLRAIFERDRAAAAQPGAMRCGICYLHFPAPELEYREQEGFYLCAGCARALGPARVPMVRRQQR